MWPIIALNVLGGLMRANAAKRAAQAQAAQDEYNATIAGTAAGDALQRGQAAEGQVKRATSERISTGQAQLAASGVDTQSGSALDTLSGQRTRGALAALVMRSNAARQAWGYEAEEPGFHNKAAYALQAGDEAFLSTLVDTAAKAYGDYSKLGGGGPGVTTPIMRVGEPTTIEPWMLPAGGT